MTNLVFAAITVALSTNTVDMVDSQRGDVKLRENIVTEAHAYEIQGKQFYHAFQPVTNVVRMELKWVEVDKSSASKSSLTLDGPTLISKAGCVTRLWDARIMSPIETNNNDSVTHRAKLPGLPPAPTYAITISHNATNAINPETKK